MKRNGKKLPTFSSDAPAKKLSEAKRRFDNRKGADNSQPVEPDKNSRSDNKMVRIRPHVASGAYQYFKQTPIDFHTMRPDSAYTLLSSNRFNMFFVLEVLATALYQFLLLTPADPDMIHKAATAYHKFVIRQSVQAERYTYAPAVHTAARRATQWHVAYILYILQGTINENRLLAGVRYVFEYLFAIRQCYNDAKPGLQWEEDDASPRPLPSVDELNQLLNQIFLDTLKKYDPNENTPWEDYV